MEAIARHREHAVDVYYRDGCFTVVVTPANDPQTIVAAMGAMDRELTDLRRLMDASYEFINWDLDIELARKLHRLELAQARPETRRVLERVF